ncbi:PREDICTED: complement decay-accelerating factor [Condylura cristata]|uniref:complement decay-accelerating factor n=1 Tax=Condylura cristata TaxID=143302 RepID=UPI0006433C62|nr:PREDICTED: complement decay-accelerating factor [Condylura cristata]
MSGRGCWPGSSRWQRGGAGWRHRGGSPQPQCLTGLRRGGGVGESGVQPPSLPDRTLRRLRAAGPAVLGPGHRSWSQGACPAGRPVGDCGFPLPVVPNAKPNLGGLSSFPEKETVTYTCDTGFVKVPGLPDSTVCEGTQWSELLDFCNRSCDVPPRLLFASLNKSFSSQNYFPAGSRVQYECRPGYRRDPTLSPWLTCLSNYSWSEPQEFCKKKSCPNPGEIQNGHVTITTDILFGSSISFSCDTGYRLEGATSSYCILRDNTVQWSQPLPECVGIHCPEPPHTDNGFVLNPSSSYVYQQSVTYRCSKGFEMVGASSIFCTVKDDEGVWSGPAPECRDNSQTPKVTPAGQETTSTKAPGTTPKPTAHRPTSAPGTTPKPTAHRPTTASVAGTKPQSTHQKPTSASTAGTRPKPSRQRPSTVSSSATEAPLASHRPTTTHLHTRFTDKAQADSSQTRYSL